MKRLVIIDGHAILYRAFHALPITLTTPDGKPVNAVYGFIRMLLKVISDLKPTHLAVAFDRPKPTFRKKLFKDYQAKRPKAPDDLIAQIDLVHQVVEAMEIPIYEKDGFEADDVIGTLAKQALRSGTKFFVAVDRPSASSGLITSSKKFAPSPRLLDVIIVTGDKDILQLVDENTRVYMPIKGLSLSRLYGKKDVKVKLPLFFSSFKKDLTLSKNEIDRLNEDTRWDLHKCYKCKKQYRDIVDRHKCTYCGKYFGETHRLPEDHDCKGNPTLPRDMKRGAGGKRPLGENSLNNI